jgi:hypothetical protein
MKIINIKEILKFDKLALTAVIDYWIDYDITSVILAYAELKRRNFDFDDKLRKKLTEFCDKNSVENIENLLNKFLKENQIESYDEFLEKEIFSIQNTKAQRLLNTGIDPSFIKDAGKSIKKVVYTVLFMSIFAVIAFIILSSTTDLDTIRNTYLIVAVLSLLCNILILVALYSAGDNLEKSVL